MAVSNSHNDQSLSSLDSSVFSGLISRPRFLSMQTESTDVDAIVQELRTQIVSKLDKNPGQSITTVGEMLRLSPTALLHILDPCLTYVECKRLIARICETCSVQPVTALDVMQRTNLSGVASSNGKLSTGLPTLDMQLRGGFSVSSITEVVGRAGVGKTHLSQQLVSEAAASFGGSIYIDTENKMSIMRLKEIASERASKRRRTDLDAVAVAHELNPADLVLENVTVHKPLTTRELLDLLNQLDEEIKQRNAERSERLPVRLLIVDSIAAPLRRDYSSPNSAMQRASAIFDIAHKLKQLADDFKLAVVVVNQVGGASGANNTQRNDTLDNDGGEFTGSLGTVWQHCISTRIALEHDGDPQRLDQEQHKIRRGMITKSIISKNATFGFELTRQGIREVPVETQTNS